MNTRRFNTDTGRSMPAPTPLRAEQVFCDLYVFVCAALDVDDGYLFMVGGRAGVNSTQRDKVGAMPVPTIPPKMRRRRVFGFCGEAEHRT